MGNSWAGKDMTAYTVVAACGYCRPHQASLVVSLDSRQRVVCTRRADRLLLAVSHHECVRLRNLTVGEAGRFAFLVEMASPPNVPGEVLDVVVPILVIRVRHPRRSLRARSWVAVTLEVTRWVSEQAARRVGGEAVGAAVHVVLQSLDVSMFGCFPYLDARHLLARHVCGPHLMQVMRVIRPEQHR